MLTILVHGDCDGSEMPLSLSIKIKMKHKRIQQWLKKKGITLTLSCSSVTAMVTNCVHFRSSWRYVWCICAQALTCQHVARFNVARPWSHFAILTCGSRREYAGVTSVSRVGPGHDLLKCIPRNHPIIDRASLDNNPLTRIPGVFNVPFAALSCIVNTGNICSLAALY